MGSSPVRGARERISPPTTIERFRRSFRRIQFLERMRGSEQSNRLRSFVREQLSYQSAVGLETTKVREKTPTAEVFEGA
jgi:hypothetical protein